MTKMVAVTACIAGIAHTYMAKANLEKFAKKMVLKSKLKHKAQWEWKINCLKQKLPTPT